MATLVYDEDCPYCYAVSTGASKLSNIEILSFEDEKVQKMLNDAFDNPSFTMYLFENDKVYWGTEAARKAAEATSLPKNIFLPALRIYPRFSKLFSVLTFRKGVRQPTCDSDRCMAAEEGGGMKKLKKKMGKDKSIEFVD